MLPTISSFNITTPPQTLVATQIPDNNALRVPYDNVEPALSTVQINNNARGNGGAVSLSQPGAQTASVPTITIGEVPAFLSGASSGLSASVQATFLAQMLGQDYDGAPTEAMKSILVEYEKLIAYSYVKYKPSNAMLPPPEPAGLFGKLLQQEKAARAVPQSAAEATARAVQATPVAAIATSVPAARPAPTATRTANTTTTIQEFVESEPVASASPIATPILAINAYLASASRSGSGNSLYMQDSV